MKPPEPLAFRQIARRLEKLRGLAEHTRIREGWIRYMRRAMCLPLTKLARECGVSQPTVQQIEKREAAGKVTIETMRKIAAAMNCEFVYAIVPKTDLKEAMRERARTKAARIVREADLHMTLEDQRVSEELEGRIERVAEELLAAGDIW